MQNRKEAGSTIGGLGVFYFYVFGQRMGKWWEGSAEAWGMEGGQMTERSRGSVGKENKKGC